MFRIIIAISLFTFPLSARPPHIQSLENNPTAAQIGVWAANAALGCVKGGVGTRKVSFWSGCWKGAIGGTIAFSGEWVASWAGHAPWLAGIGKVVHSAGVSVQDNLAQQIPVLSRYQLELGPATLTWQEGIVPKFSYSLVSAVGLGVASGYGKFDLLLTLQTLTPVFVHNEGLIDSKWALGAFTGFCSGNTILIMDPKKRPSTFAHELNHAISWANFRLAGNAITLGGWEIGRDAYYGALSLMNLTAETYWYHPLEIQAYSMGRIKHYRGVLKKRHDY